MDIAALEPRRALHRECMTTLTLMRPALVVLFEAFHENKQVTIGQIEPEAFAACMLLWLPLESQYSSISIAVPIGIPGNRGTTTVEACPLCLRRCRSTGTDTCSTTKGSASAPWHTFLNTCRCMLCLLIDV